MPPQAIAKAIRVLGDGREREDSELIDWLVAEGLDRSYATRLVPFIPVPNARVALRGLGVPFSDRFHRSYGNGRKSADQRRDSDPARLEVEASSEANLRALSSEQRSWAAGCSPEMHVISQVLNAGGEVKNQGFSPLIVWWPKE